MTILDKVSATSRSFVQNFIDKEPVNYIEAGLLYGIVTVGRYNVAMLTLLHNHAQEPELKPLIKEAIDTLTEKTIKYCEDQLKTGGAKLPTIRFNERALESGLEIPNGARYSDMEIAMVLVNLHGACQTAILTAISQSYHLDISIELRNQLNDALDWGYRLQQLMLHKNWLPKIAKVVEH